VQKQGEEIKPHHPMEPPGEFKKQVG